MWSFFSRDPSKDFNYEIGEKVEGLEDRFIWSLHHGKKKTTGEPVSVFMYDIKGGGESQLLLVKASFKRLKTLRHPNIVTYLDGLETEKVIYMVTEPVTPLSNYLKDNVDDGSQNELAISWGLHQVTKGLSFLVNDGGLIHNNVCILSIFVDRAGEWKLGGVDYMYQAQGPDSSAPIKILPYLEKYDPPEKSQSKKVPTDKWSADMWGLGCLIWEVFNGDLPKTASLKTLGKIPKNLVPCYCELVGANPKSRPNPSKFLDKCRNNGGFMNNDFVDTMLFLEEIQIKEHSEKVQFFNSLSKSIESFPPNFCRHKIVPQLLTAFEYGNAGSNVLIPLLKMGKYLDSDEYQQKIVPCVVKLFSCSDRETRVRLLQQIDTFIEHLQPATVNNQIFPQVVQGFMDTNPIVREHTIKAMMSLAPKLNYKNLNDELMKHFARLQSKDDQGGIRTNTTVCLGKIACHLNPQMRQKILVSAFLRATRDPFPPARQAGVLAMAATHNFYTIQDSAVRLLPALCTLTVDHDKSVRDQAFKSVKCFLAKIEKASESYMNPEVVANLEKDVNVGGGSEATAASWAGWAMTGMTTLTSKIIKTKPQQQRHGAPPSTTVKVPSSKPQQQQASTTSSKPDDLQPEETVDVTDEDDVEDVVEPDVEDTAGDGWEDEGWGTMNDYSDQMKADDNDGWDTEDWGSLEDTTNEKVSSGGAKTMDDGWDNWNDDFTVDTSTNKTTSSYNWKTEETEDDFFSNIQKPSKPSQIGSISQKKSAAARVESQKKSSGSGGDGWSEGWDDDGDSGWGTTKDNWSAIDQGPSDKELARQKREERKLQRQKEMEQKRAARQGSGAMKLGSKKLAAE